MTPSCFGLWGGPSGLADIHPCAESGAGLHDSNKAQYNNWLRARRRRCILPGEFDSTEVDRALEDNRRLVTQILRELDLSDAKQAEELLAVVYDELRQLARSQLRGERADHTLQPTALVHEAYIRLVDASDITWECRAHFFGTAARAMRQILVDHARRRSADKRGGGWERVTLDTGAAREDGAAHEDVDAVDVLDLHAALEKLSVHDPDLARLVELRFFAGLTVDEAADALGVSPRKAAKDWTVARVWLQRELGGS
jgi:RNA polymerase sigma factor (TIGR02999 family)